MCQDISSQELRLHNHSLHNHSLHNHSLKLNCNMYCCTYARVCTPLPVLGPCTAHAWPAARGGHDPPASHPALWRAAHRHACQPPASRRNHHQQGHRHQAHRHTGSCTRNASQLTVIFYCNFTASSSDGLGHMHCTARAGPRCCPPKYNALTRIRTSMRLALPSGSCCLSAPGAPWPLAAAAASCTAAPAWPGSARSARALM